jgi:hypothetical protein
MDAFSAEGSFCSNEYLEGKKGTFDLTESMQKTGTLKRWARNIRDHE